MGLFSTIGKALGGFASGGIFGGVTGLLGGLGSDQDARRQEDLQKEFAQNGIRWKVADAQAAGIHPLAALGAQTQTYSPVYAGSYDMPSMGQDLSRAISATRPQGEQLSAYEKSVQELSLTKMGLENELLASQIAKINQAGQPPGLPGAGVVDVPLQRIGADPSNPAREAGAVPEVGYLYSGPRGRVPVPADTAKERIEDDFFSQALWNVRNRIAPSFGLNETPPSDPLPEGYDAWKFNPFTQEYEPMRRGLFGIYY